MLQNTRLVFAFVIKLGFESFANWTKTAPRRLARIVRNSAWDKREARQRYQSGLKRAAIRKVRLSSKPGPMARNPPGRPPRGARGPSGRRTAGQVPAAMFVVVRRMVRSSNDLCAINKNRTRRLPAAAAPFSAYVQSLYDHQRPTGDPRPRRRDARQRGQHAAAAGRLSRLTPRRSSATSDRAGSGRARVLQRPMADDVPRIVARGGRTRARAFEGQLTARVARSKDWKQDPGVTVPSAKSPWQVRVEAASIGLGAKPLRRSKRERLTPAARRVDAEHPAR
jgi:hypothetical protein